MKTTTYLLGLALGAGFILAGCADNPSTSTTTTSTTSTSAQGVSTTGRINNGPGDAGSAGVGYSGGRPGN